jgi:hypothetical protein
VSVWDMIIYGWLTLSLPIGMIAGPRLRKAAERKR